MPMRTACLLGRCLQAPSTITQEHAPINQAQRWLNFQSVRALLEKNHGDMDCKVTRLMCTLGVLGLPAFPPLKSWLTLKQLYTIPGQYSKPAFKLWKLAV
eukprot:TRINITY_DN13871_c0_g1_i1.p1 TRINITY_DN13871_c0_g1~~TRINITY_DN13871_c0_g1_i1.p1  ORF type:complete len:100 (-),score=8.22 TRINITY_DN13871_c0_g1_i1:139-438(-)